MTTATIDIEWPARLAAACALSPADDELAADARRARRAQADERAAAVLIGVTNSPSPAIYFTQRSAALSHHPGQISFPGGRIEASDVSVGDAALREAREEIGLDPARVALVGALPCYRTVTNFAITPVVGWISPNTVCQPDGREVVHLFSVPLDVVLDDRAFRYRPVERDGQRYRIYSLDYEGHHIWGATAAMLAVLAQRVARVAGQSFEIDRPIEA